MKKKWIGAVVALLVAIAVFVLVFRLISGTFDLLSNALDAVVGIVLILAMVIIVVWMFLYAAKKKK